MIRHVLKIVWNRKGANALVILEVFVSFLVVFAVAAASIFSWRSFHRPLGYEWRDVWHLQVRLGNVDRADQAAVKDANARIERLLREIDALAPVTGAAAGRYPPYARSTSRMGWNTTDGRSISAEVIEATPEFAQVLGIEPVAGRWFEPADAALHWRPVVVNRRLARDLFGDGEVLGQAVDLGPPDEGEEPTEMRVVGVVDDYRKGGELAAATNMLIEAAWLDRARWPMSHLVVKLAPGTPAAFEEELAKRLHALEPGWSFEIRSLAANRQAYLRLRLAPLVAAGVVAAFLILMVGLGLVGVLWQNVTQRTMEIGLRRAKGATRMDVYRQILGEMLILAAFGVALGALVVVQVPVLGWFGFLDGATYGLAFATSTLGILLLAALCGLYPSWLAARIQPAEALHYE